MFRWAMKSDCDHSMHHKIICNDTAISQQAMAMISQVTGRSQGAFLWFAQSNHKATMPLVAQSNHEDKNAGQSNNKCHKLSPAMVLAVVLQFDKNQTISLFKLSDFKARLILPIIFIFPNWKNDRKFMKFNYSKGKFPQGFGMLPCTPLTAVSNTMWALMGAWPHLRGSTAPTTPPQANTFMPFCPWHRPCLNHWSSSTRTKTSTISWVELEACFTQLWKDWEVKRIFTY